VLPGIEGSYLRLIDGCITNSRLESDKEEEEEMAHPCLHMQTSCDFRRPCSECMTVYRGTSLIRNTPLMGPYSRTI